MKKHIPDEKQIKKIWKGMKTRCSEKHWVNHPSYTGCSISQEWLDFNNFKIWYISNYYETSNDDMMCLDKDILVKGNKIYSPDTCCIVPYFINLLFIKANKRRGSLPIGVCLAYNGKYQSQCQFGREYFYLGIFNTPEEAFQEYKKYKEVNMKLTANIYKKYLPKKVYEAMCNYIVEITD